jgi:hypothetical protein
MLAQRHRTRRARVLGLLDDSNNSEGPDAEVPPAGERSSSI